MDIDAEDVDLKVSPVRDLVDFGRFATEDSPLAMAAVEGIDHRIRYANGAFCRLAGADPGALIGRPFGEAVQEGSENGCVALLDRVFESQQPASLADQAHLGLGSDPAFLSYAVWPAIAPDDGPAGLMIHVTDTTDRVVAWRQVVALNQQLVLSAISQMALAESAEELNLQLVAALRETNHRVKNSLQMVAGLIDITHKDGTENPELERLRAHVRALARIHDLLTQQSTADQVGHDFVSIPGEALLQNLLVMLEATMRGNHIRVDVEAGPIPAKKATSIALIVNECVMNATKHGAGDVEVSLYTSGDSTRLTIRDHGPGFPEGFDAVAGANTGLELVARAAQWDLQGDVSFDNAPGGGGQVTVTFPAAPPEPTGPPDAE